MKYTLILFTVLSFSLTSCMHMMMMGGHGDHREHQATAVTKEIINGDYSLSITIEPMTVGTEGKISFSLRSKHELPESVSVHYMISTSSSIDSSANHDHGEHSTPNAEFTTIHQNITMIKGTSTVVYTPTVAGNFVLSVQIDNLPNTNSSLTIEANFMVHEKKSRGMMGMDGMMGISSEYWYLGAIAMAGMMVVMWTTRGSIF